MRLKQIYKILIEYLYKVEWILMKHEIKLYGEIIELVWAESDFQYIDLKYVDTELSKLTVAPGDEVVFNIHSLGGDTAIAFAVYNKIRRFGKENQVSITTRIDGYCASAGVILLLAGDKRIGNKYAEPFVHNAWTYVVGDKNEAEKQFEELENTDNMIASLYEERTKITKEKALELMGNDTWISAEQCLEFGFYTELENEDSSKPVYNYEKQIIFNSFKNTRKISINNKMTQEEKNSLIDRFFNLFNEKKPSKNAMLYTDKNEEVVFAELNEGEKPKVGDKATINGKNASGTVNMADGSKFEFEDGKIKTIQESNSGVDTVTLNALNARLDALAEENKGFKETIATQNSTIETLKTDLGKYKEMETTFNSLKQIVGEYSVDVTNENNPNVNPAPTQNRFENFNYKKSK